MFLPTRAAGSLPMLKLDVTADVAKATEHLSELAQQHVPNAAAWGAIAFNAILVIGFAQVAWFFLVRTLPPLASTLSVMLIPVLGVFSGAWWLGEVLHWQDWTSVALMVVAIASVLWPARK